MFEPRGGQNLPTLSFGIWNYQGVAIYQDYYGSLYAFSKCNSFPDSVDFDSKWNTAKAFSVMAFLFGFLSLFLFCAVPPKMQKTASAFYMVVTLFQGLVMIQLSSDFCDNNEIVAGMAGLYQETCKMDYGFKLGISSFVLYFRAGIAGCFIPNDDEEDAPKEVDAPNAVEEGKPPGDTGVVETVEATPGDKGVVGENNAEA